jgi:hypothetical protein
MEQPPQLPPLDFGWSAFDTELVLQSPADLSAAFLNLMRKMSGEIPRVDPDPNLLACSQILVEDSTDQEWEAACSAMHRWDAADQH